MHPRQIIRDAFAARLADALPDTDPPAHRTACLGRVYPSRTKPLFPKDLPASLVYTRSEKIDKASGGADGFGPLIRHLDLAIEIIAAGDDEGLNAVLDDIAVQVEQALDGFEVPPQPLPDWDWMVTDIRLAEVDTDFSPEGEKVVGATRLTYAITYETAPKMVEDGPSPPARIFVGYLPNIGTGSENDYTELT